MNKPRTPAANGTSYLDVASPGVNFLRKVSSGSNPHGHGSSCHPWQHPPVANVLFAPPCLSTLFEKISPPPDKHLRKDIPSTVGVLRFEKLRGSMEDKFPCRYFLGRVKNKNETIWVYSEKFACQILNFFKMSTSEPVFSL